MTPRTIRPSLLISRSESVATVEARVEFDDFDEAMEFSAVIVDYLKRRMRQMTDAAEQPDE